jgi:hypothetical protein
MPYRDTAEYRHQAKECRRRANATDDVLLKMHWLELADTWKGLAERAAQVAPSTPEVKTSSKDRLSAE